MSGGDRDSPGNRGYTHKYRPHWALIEKKEANMKKDIGMNEATIQALHKSIAHWNDICYGMEDDYFSDNCALCEKYRDGSRCGDCPVRATESAPCGSFCESTTWGRYFDRHGGNTGFCTVDSADAAEAMLELLVSLLPKDETRKKYDVALDEGSNHINYCMCDGRLNVSGITGITTDGRNAFPQAKYVWEKVFEYQVCGPIPEMPSYEWVADLPRASFVWSWPEAKTKDGKCVTCGQVVKRKVTKYKAVCKSHPDADVRISCEYYESEEDFNRRCDLTLFVSLILETAKEFDA